MTISDFKLAENFLRGVSHKYKIPFVDVPIEFMRIGDETFHGCKLDEGKIVLHHSDTLGRTLLGIIGCYLKNLHEITGVQAPITDADIVKLVSGATAAIRCFIYSSKILPQPDEESGLRCSLRQFAFEWLILRDIVAPYYRVLLKDIPVLMAKCSTLDAARYIATEDDLGIDFPDAPVIVVNTSVESNTFRSAFLLVEAIRAHGLDAGKIVSDLLSNPELKAKIYGFSKLSFVDEGEVVEFLMTLAAITGFAGEDWLIDGGKSDVWFKEAQSATGLTAAWFYPELTESILEPARGPDYSVSKRLNPFIEELWGRVADEKKRRGKEDMSLEDLLRVQSEGMRPKPNLLINALLSEERIW
jgi:hypothetical protein